MSKIISTIYDIMLYCDDMSVRVEKVGDNVFRVYASGKRKPVACGTAKHFNEYNATYVQMEDKIEMDSFDRGEAAIGHLLSEDLLDGLS